MHYDDISEEDFIYALNKKTEIRKKYRDENDNSFVGLYGIEEN